MDNKVIIFGLVAFVLFCLIVIYYRRTRKLSSATTFNKTGSNNNSSDRSYKRSWENDTVIPPEAISSTFFQRDSNTYSKRTRLVNRDIQSCLIDKNQSTNCVGDTATKFIVLTFKDRSYNVSKVKIHAEKGFKYLMVSTFDEDDNPLSVSEDDFTVFANPLTEYNFQVNKTGVKKIIIADVVNILDINDIKIFSAEGDAPDTPYVVDGQTSKPYLFPGELSDRTATFKCDNSGQNDFAKGPKYLIKLDDSKFVLFSNKGKLSTLKLADNKVYYGTANEGLIKVFYNYCLEEPILKMYYDDGNTFISQTCRLDKFDISETQPEGLETIDKSSSYIEMSWISPKEPVVSYSLDYSDIKTPSKVIHKDNIDLSVYNDKDGIERVSTKITGLNQDTTYNFSLYAVNYNNHSNPTFLQENTLKK